MKCPVCNTECMENLQFCKVCAWEFNIYVSGISEQEKKLYNQKLKIAQKNWNELNTLRIGTIEKEKKTQKATDSKIMNLGFVSLSI